MNEMKDKEQPPTSTIAVSRPTQLNSEASSHADE
jgi:hypothetical protein